MAGWLVSKMRMLMVWIVAAPEILGGQFRIVFFFFFVFELVEERGAVPCS